MDRKKDPSEERAKDHFVAFLKEQGRGDWVVSRTDVVVDQQTNINFDYELRSGEQHIALEIFRLVETKEEIIRSRDWTTITEQITARLRKKRIKGYTILVPYNFQVSRRGIAQFASDTADLLEAAIRENAGVDPIEFDGFEIKRIDGFSDVSLFSIGPGGAINPTGDARGFVVQKLPKKNKQLNIANRERILLIVNWMMLVGQGDMIEACTLIDFSQFENIDKVYFETQSGGMHLVFDRAIYVAFQPDGEPPQQIDSLFVSWLSNHLYRKESQAFRLVRRITEQRNSMLWLPATSREQLVAFGEAFLESGETEKAQWVIDNLQNDPDPSVENSADDPTGRFNLHHRTKEGERNHLIQSVRGRLCWLLMRLVARPSVGEYERVFETVEKYATGENLYVRVQATFPLLELAKRRFTKTDDGARLMSVQLAERIRALALRMADENVAYPSVLESVAHVLRYIPDLGDSVALKTIKQLLTIERSEGAPHISAITIYFAFFRENQFKHLEPFKSEPIRGVLKERLAGGSGQFRGTAADHFKADLRRNQIEFDALVPYLEAMLDGPFDSVVNHHFYEIAAAQAAAHPNAVGRLVERAVLGELKSLDLGGREIWHSKPFSEALRVVEQAGPEDNARIAQLKKSMEPYRKQRRMFDLDDL